MPNIISQLHHHWHGLQYGKPNSQNSWNKGKLGNWHVYVQYNNSNCDNAGTVNN